MNQIESMTQIGQELDDAIETLKTASESVVTLQTLEELLKALKCKQYTLSISFGKNILRMYQTE